MARLGEAGLADAVAQGFVVRHRRGTYALPDVEAARLAATRLLGVVSHSSAALMYGLDLLSEPDCVHVTLPSNAMRRWVPDGVRLHYASLSPDERRAGLTSIRRTIVDCARTLPLPEALAVTDSALRRSVATRAALLNELDQTRGRGVVRARCVLTRADPRAATVFESALRSITLDLGLTCLVPQLPVHTASVRARVDLGDPVRRIAIEAESFEFHGRRAQLTRDCARTNALGLAGWLVLRFSWEQVVFDPQYVAGVVLEAHGSRVCKASRR